MHPSELDAWLESELEITYRPRRPDYCPHCSTYGHIPAECPKPPDPKWDNIKTIRGNR